MYTELIVITVVGSVLCLVGLIVGSEVDVAEDDHHEKLEKQLAVQLDKAEEKGGDRL